ncbi:MAG: hypothetical protein HYW96_00015 [Candidatus Wildermuthbacteria bacterium]|nr:hypothetical protein [Candidatus Wildermuthbacteria bacterium]
MSAKTFQLVAGIIFAVVAVMHLSRVVFGWQVVLGEWVVPAWISYFGLVVAGFLAYQGFRLSKKS